MTQGKLLPPGFFCWVDVAVSDPTQTHTFFTDLFGWGRKVRPTEEAHAYSIMTVYGHHVAGICQVEGTGPSQWMSYLLVDDLTVASAKAQSLGASLLKENIDIATFGLMTVVEDPAGAVFALWESKRGETSDPKGHSIVHWTELVSDNTEVAKNFYCALAGWTHRDIEFGGKPYHIFSKDGEDVCGMMESTTSAPHWMVHFQVENCHVTCSLAEDLGGSVVRTPFDLEEIGRCAVLKCTSGGTFGIVQPKQ